jgi:predicted permease
MLRRLRYFLNRRRLERELEEEMQFHAEHTGNRFGDTTRWRERSIDEWGSRALDEAIQDVRYAARGIRRQPGFAVTAFLLLALGVGVNTAIFAVIRAAILSSLPVRDASSLVQLGFYDPAENQFRPNHTHVAFEMFAANAHTIRDFFGLSQPFEVNVTANGVPELTHAQAVTPNAFVVLGAAGPLAPSTVTLTHGYWQRRFGGDPTVVGGRLMLNSVPFTIGGVLPAGFAGLALGEHPDVFFHADRVNEVLMRNARNPGNMWLRIMGYLRPGATIQQAQAELEPVSRRAIENLYSAVPVAMLPQIRKIINSFRFRVIPASAGAHSELRDSVRAPLLILLSSAGLLLLIACANLAGLALARSVSRQREFGIRVALGCGRARLLRQMLAESVLIAVSAGGAALFIEPLARRALIAMVADSDALVIRSDAAVLVFLAGITAAAGVLIGILPAWRACSRAQIVEDRMARSPRLGRALMAAQVALSLVLIAGAAMFTQTFRTYRNIDPGFRRGHLIAVGVNPGTLRYTEDRLLTYYRSALEQLRRVPGVTSATLSRMPMGELTWTTLAQAGGVRSQTGRNLAGPQFAMTVGLRMAAGRDFSEADVRNRTALVNESFVKQYFAGANPLGRHVTFMDVPDRPFEIIGVVKDARDRGPKHSARPVVYTAWENDRMAWLTFSIRTQRDPDTAMADIRQALRSADSAVPVSQVQTADEVMERQLRREGMMASLGTAFGGLALAVAAVGLYALLAHSIVRRTREFGVRIAIGATRNNVVRLVFRQAAVLVAAGGAIGLPLAVAASWAVRNQLYGVQPADPAVLGAAAATIAVVAVIASVIPAFRASRIDPVEALRHE